MGDREHTAGLGASCHVHPCQHKCLLPAVLVRDRLWRYQRNTCSGVTPTLAEIVKRMAIKKKVSRSGQQSLQSLRKGGGSSSDPSHYMPGVYRGLSDIGQ